MSLLLPTRTRQIDRSLLFVGSLIIERLDRARSLSSVWESLKDSKSVGSYSRFILALDMLFILNVIKIGPTGKLSKVSRHDNVNK